MSKRKKPDGIYETPKGIEVWWQGYNYRNVIPEELIDAELASQKEKRKAGQKYE